MAQAAWPDWWEWKLELGPHPQTRMVDRAFNEVDLRRMLSDARGMKVDTEPGRWAVATGLAGQPWEAILEPDRSRRLVVVVTAYRVD